MDPLDIYLEEIRRITILPVAEQQALAVAAVNGDSDARDRLITANLPLVVSVAKGFAGMPMALSDRIQEGNIGLIKAAATYDPSKGALFSSWATNRVKWHIYRANQQRGSLIAIPVHVQDTEQQIRVAALRLLQTLGRTPKHSEVRAALNLRHPTWYDAAIETRPLRSPKSLDRPISKDSETTLHEKIADELTAPAIDSGMSSFLAEALDRLPADELQSLAAVIGVTDEPLSIRKAAQALGVSYTTVRARHQSALATLRTALEASAQ